MSIKDVSVSWMRLFSKNRGALAPRFYSDTKEHFQLLITFRVDILGPAKSSLAKGELRAEEKRTVRMVALTPLFKVRFQSFE